MNVVFCVGIVLWIPMVEMNIVLDFSMGPPRESTLVLQSKWIGL